MKLKVNRLAFLKAIQTACKAAPSRTTKDILKNVKLQATTNAIVLLATDSEISLRVDVSEVSNADGGECLLPTARIIQVVSEMGNDTDLNFSIKTGEIEITGERCNFKLLAEDPDGFPPVPSFTGEDFFKMKAADVRRLIKRTIFASDTESTRYALGGVQVEFGMETGRVIFAATDSRRLAVDSAPFEITGRPFNPSTPQVIPNKAIKLLLAIAEDQGDVQFSFDKSGNGLAIKAGLTTLTSQFVQGRFPDWRRVLPTRFETTIELVVGPFLSAIKQSLILRTDESRAADLEFSKGQMRIKSSVADMGASNIDIPIGYDGEKFTIRFDPSYIADVMKVLDISACVQFKLISFEDPGLFVLDEYRYLIMPLSKD